MEIFEPSLTGKVISAIRTTFQSSPKLINAHDEEENPTDRTAEIKAGKIDGISKLSEDKSDERYNYQYFGWDLPKEKYTKLIEYVNKELPPERCSRVLAKEGFFIDTIDENEISKLATIVEWISLTAYLTESPIHLRLFIRLQLNPSRLDPASIGKCVRILERAVEMYFRELKGLSSEIFPCSVPSVPKILSLSVMANNKLMNFLREEFDKARASREGFALNKELTVFLNMLGYDGNGFPSVIKESDNLFRILWHGAFTKNDQTFHVVDFTDEKKLIVGRMKHSLPVDSIIAGGTLDVISDGLSYTLFSFSLMEFVKTKTLAPLKKDYREIQDSSFKYFLSYTTAKEKRQLSRLLEIGKEILVLQDILEQHFKNQIRPYYLFMSQIYRPEVYMSGFSIFDRANMIDKGEETYPVTFMRSIGISYDNLKSELNNNLQKLLTNIEKSIELLNSMIQLKLTRMNLLLTLLTSFLFIIALIELFGLRIY